MSGGNGRGKRPATKRAGGKRARSTSQPAAPRKQRGETIQDYATAQEVKSLRVEIERLGRYSERTGHEVVGLDKRLAELERGFTVIQNDVRALFRRNTDESVARDLSGKISEVQSWKDSAESRIASTSARLKRLEHASGLLKMGLAECLEVQTGVADEAVTQIVIGGWVECR